MSETIDKTAEFFSFCKKLQPGQLCHVKNFDLQDVMTAIELMDPKMDSRMKIQRKIIYLKEALDKELLPLNNDMDPYLVLGIIDETLACLVNWLKGDTLGQTVFINMYMHCTDLIENKALRGFCEAMKSIIIFVKFVIFKASVVEEEDFIANSFRLPLEDCLPDHRVTGLLKDADDEITKALKSNSNCDNIDGLICLQYRVRFVRNLVLWAINTKKYLDTGNNKTAKETYQESNRYLAIMKEMVDKMIETVNHGTSAGDGKHLPMQKDYGLTGFEAYLNQPLLPPAIPRCADIEDRKPALTYLSGLLVRLQHIMKVLNIDLANDIFVAWDFLKAFGTYGCEGSKNTCALSRSLLLTFYLNQFGFPNSDVNNEQSASIKVDILKSSLQHFLKLSCWSEIDESIKNDPKLMVFISACAENKFQIPITYSLNRSRQRTRIEMIIDANWELYEECSKVDRLLRALILQKNTNSKRPKDIPPLFSSFVAVIQFRTMLDYLISGFELDLYAPHELLSVYFILSESVLKYYLSHLTEIDYIQTREQSNPVRLASNKKTRRDFERDITNNLLKLQRLRAKLKAYQQLTHAYFLLFIGLTQEKRVNNIIDACGHYSNPELCYFKRFEPLVARGWFPETAGYSILQSRMTELINEPSENGTSGSVLHLYEQAAIEFDFVRKFIDQQAPDIFTESTAVQLSTVAKNNWIVARLLSKKMKPGQPVLLKFDETVEKAFPLIKIK